MWATFQYTLAVIEPYQRVLTIFSGFPTIIEDLSNRSQDIEPGLITG
jgi:hypothetical protein